MKHLKSYQIFESTEIVMAGLENAIKNNNEKLLDDLMNQYSDMIEYDNIDNLLKLVLNNPDKHKYLERLNIPKEKINDVKFMIYNIYRQIYEGVNGGGGATAILDYARYGELSDLIYDLENELKSSGYVDTDIKGKISFNKAEIKQIISKMSNYGSLKNYVNALLSTEHSDNLEFYVYMITKMKQTDTKEEAESILNDFFDKFK